MSNDGNRPENPIRKVDLQAHGWRGTVLNNLGNSDRQGGGFNPLFNSM